MASASITRTRRWPMGEALSIFVGLAGGYWLNRLLTALRVPSPIQFLIIFSICLLIASGSKP